MTIDEAIEILENLSGKGPYFGTEKLVEAATLGKEALKRVKADRYYQVASQEPLPGETE